MRLLHRSLAAIVVLALLASCQAGQPSPTADPTAAATATAAATPPATDAPGTGSPEPTGSPVPQPTGADFTCDLPIVTEPTVAIANIVDVRVGTHEGYDRVVFEFEQGIPEATLARAEPPFTQDGSGFPVEVEGDSFLALVMRGGTKQTEAGTSSYDGPTEFETGFETLLHLVEGGDFERQSSWYFGLDDAACINLFTMEEPYRLVIDLER